MEVFKIRNIDTGLYFSQLQNTYYSWINPKWNKTGKMWNKMEDINQFIGQFKLNKGREVEFSNLSKCEVVKFELKEIDSYNIKAIYNL
jgi:hypothetical protein